MHRPTYALARSIARFIGGLHVRNRVTHGHRLARRGPYVLACTHVGHLEPALLTTLTHRPIYWVARVEFFRYRWARTLLHGVGAIPVNRCGVPVRAVRESVRRLRDGGVVGIFPEGGRTTGDRQAVLGGAIKGGGCLIAARAGVPVVPVVVVGIDALHAVAPWLPGRRTTVRTIVGPPILPYDPTFCRERRECRHEMTRQLRAAFVALHAELLAGELS